MLAGPFGDALVDAQKALVEALGAPLRDMLSVAWDKGESGAYELNEEMENALRWQTKPNDVLAEFGLLVYKDLLGSLRGPIPARIVRPEVDRGDVITPPPPPSREELHLWEQFGGALDAEQDVRGAGPRRGRSGRRADPVRGRLSAGGVGDEHREGVGAHREDPGLGVLGVAEGDVGGEVGDFEAVASGVAAVGRLAPISGAEGAHSMQSPPLLLL